MRNYVWGLLFIASLLSGKVLGQKKYLLEDAIRWEKSAESFERNSSWDSAQHYYDKAANVHYALKDTNRYIDIRHKSGSLYLNIYKFKKANTIYEAVYKEFKNTIESNPEYKVNVFRQLARCSNFFGNNLKAEEYLLEALDEYREHSLDNPAIHLSLLNGLSYTYRALYKYDKAIYYALQSISSEELTPLELSHAYNSIGLSYSRMYSHKKSMDAYLKCLQIRQEHNPKWVPFVINNIGLRYQQMNDYDSSEYWLKKGIEQSNKLFDEKKLIHAALIANLAKAYSNQGRYQKALDAINESIKIRSRITPESPTILNSYLTQFHNAILLENVDRVNESKEVIEAFINKGLASEEMLISFYNALGQSYLKNDQPKEAEKYFDMSLSANGGNLDPSFILANYDSINFKNKFEVFRSISSKILVLAKRPSLEQDEDKLKTMVTYFDYIKNEMQAQASLFNEPFGLAKFTQTQTNLRTSLMLAAETLYKKTGDFKYVSFMAEQMESSRMSLLKEKLRYEKGVHFKKLPDSLIDRRRELLTKKYYLSQKSVASKEVYNLETELYALDQKLKVDFPDFHQLIVENNRVDLNKIKRSLSKSQLIIQYHFIQDKLYCLAHSRDHDKVMVIDWHERKDKLIDSLLKGLTSDNHTLSYQNINRLSQSLRLSEFIPENITELIIIPDQKLASIPFEILPIGKQKYLIESKSVKYVSAFNNWHKQKTKDSNPKLTLAFAPFSEGENKGYLAVHGGLEQVERAVFYPLPSSKSEVEVISKLFSGQAIFGKEASESTFKALAPKADIIHLATHSMVNDKSPLYNKILFSLEEDGQEDGSLHTYELFNMNLTADLVTLSACNTGIGKYYTGEGVLGLATGFRFAGVPNLLISLWSVPDESTSKIMQSFYSHLKDGRSKPEALRLAKLDYLKKADEFTSSPYYWAGFVLNTQVTNDTKTNKVNPIFVIIALMGVFSLGVGMELRRTRKSS